LSGETPFLDTAERTLAALWAGGRFAHALLIEGGPKSGKKTLALRAAAYLLCRAEPQDAPCGRCASCHKLKSGSHPDLTVIDGTDQKSLGVQQVRAMRAAAFIAPHEAPRRVFLILHAHKMTPQAQNVLLKLLEEPPEGAHFILTALSRGTLLPTVLSRLTIISLPEPPYPQRLDTLSALRPDLPEALLRSAAALSPTVGQALFLLSDDGARKRAEDSARLVENALSLSKYAMLCTLSGYEANREEYARLLSDARAVCASSLTDPARSRDRLRLAAIAGIMEEMLAAARQNVNTPLISAVLAGRLSEPAHTGALPR
jgi:DNA polymerase-3 subunit delta'